MDQKKVELWTKLLKDSTVFSKSNIRMVMSYIAEGGVATCKNLSNKYGESENYYSDPHLAARIKEVAPGLEEPLIFVKKTNKGTCYKVAPELMEAIKTIDTSDICLSVARVAICSYDKLKNENLTEDVYYKMINEGRMLSASLGRSEIGDFAFVLLNEEDWIFVQITHELRIEGENRCFSFRTLKKGENESVFPIRRMGGIGKNAAEHKKENMLKKLTGYSFVDLWKLKNEVLNEMSQPINIPMSSQYSKKEFLGEVFLKSSDLDELLGILKNKKNLILQGAPGVGKTFAARRLAYVFMGDKNDEQIEFVQFHQSYTYEDFVMGYKPVNEGFQLVPGIFYEFCKKAEEDPEKPYFFIIDEINRGNTSKIFGEIFMLIEKDYRGTEIKLQYTKELFSVPENLYIIGMMNTADRSLAMIDYALRRRFSFFEMVPGFNSDGFKQYQKKLGSQLFDNAIEKIKELNTAIEADAALGRGFCIGHSYFCNQEVVSSDWLKSVIKYDVLPMLREYWFDDLDKVQLWSESLLEMIND